MKASTKKAARDQVAAQIQNLQKRKSKAEIKVRLEEAASKLEAEELEEEEREQGNRIRRKKWRSQRTST